MFSKFCNKKVSSAFFLFFCSLSLFSQLKITGKVLSGDDSEPLIGANLKVKGTVSSGTITDINGNFSLIVPDEKTTLIVSYIGMNNEEVIVGKNTSLVIKLSSKTESLKDVVVIGYGTSSRKDLTGSLSSINSKELMKVRSGSVLESLGGKLAGVKVTSSSGEPGAGVNISIRGGNSLNAGTQPLYIIDGMQIDVNSNEVGQSTYSQGTSQNPLAGLNPNDIESIDILKDASATAIYGSRGANGVIIITTKSGGKGTGSVSVDVFSGIASVNKTIDVLQGQEYANYRYTRTPTGQWSADTDGDGKFDSPKDYSQSVSHNWQKELFRVAFTKSCDVGVTSSQEGKLRFSSNLGFLDQQGIIKNNSFKRVTGRFKFEYIVNSKLSIGASSNILYTEANGAVVSNGAGSYNGLIQSFILFNPFNTLSDASDPDNGGLSNPVDFIDNAYKKTPLLRTLADFNVSYKILPNLTFRSSINGGLTSSKGEEWYPTSTSWGYTPKGLALLSEASTMQWQNSNTLTYTKQINRKDYLNLMLGFEASEYQLGMFRMRAEGFKIQTYDAIFDIGQGSVFSNIGSSKTKESRLSQFGRINYNLNNKYLFTATLRRDGSSKFGENNKYALFPSGAFAWKAHEEKFLKKIALINELKIRTSFGSTGNDRIDAYRSLSRLDKSYYGNSTGEGVDFGLVPAEIANPNLKWEVTYQYDAGLDLQLFKNKLGISLDVYHKDTRDMLLRADVPSQSGSFKQWQNLGRVTNRGVELTLNTTNFDTKDFTWKTTFNFNLNRNKVVSLGSVSSVSVNVVGGHIVEVGRVLVGSAIGSGWGYVWDGVYQTTDFEANGTTLKSGVAIISGVTSKPGDLKFKDLSGDGIVDPVNDKKVISNSEPKSFGGITNNFTYKNFDLSVFLQWSYGNQVMNIGRYRYEGYVPYFNLSKSYWDNVWTATNPTNNYPAIDGNGKTESSSYYVEDASFLRIKNIAFGYNFSTNFCRRIKIKSARIHLGCDNVFTFTNYTGFDPEVSYYDKMMTGLDNISYPRSRTVTVGCNLTF